MGITFDLHATRQRMEVMSVSGQAAELGVKPGWVIYKINGQPAGAAREEVLAQVRQAPGGMLNITFSPGSTTRRRLRYR